MDQMFLYLYFGGIREVVSRGLGTSGVKFLGEIILFSSIMMCMTLVGVIWLVYCDMHMTDTVVHTGYWTHHPHYDRYTTHEPHSSKISLQA